MGFRSLTCLPVAGSYLLMAAGCSLGPKSPLEVVVLQGDDRRPVANAEVSILAPFVGISFETRDWSAKTSADGIAEFSRIPDQRGLNLRVEANGVTYSGAVIHPREHDCRETEFTDFFPAAPKDDKLYILLRCVPK